jgi:hypothetical protein
MKKIVTPFVSVNDDEPDNRFPVSIYQHGTCERSDEGGCSDGPFYGDDDPHSPDFCAKHFHGLHSGDRKQSHIEPMTEQELAALGIVKA